MLAPRPGDLAAQAYRVDLFVRRGLTVWDANWYAGHHTLGYSLLFPALAAAVGLRLAGVISTLASSVLFGVLARRTLGAGAPLATALAVGTLAANLLSGRLTFALGCALALAAVLAAKTRHHAAALALGAATALASPVAAAFLALAGVAWGLTGERVGLGVAAAALAPVLALGVLAPEGGAQPFVGSSLWPLLVVVAVSLALLPRSRRTLRLGAALYGVAALAAYAIPSPMGGNAVRLGALLAAPLLAGVLWPRHRAAAIALGLALVVWAWLPAVRDLRAAARDPSTRAAYYQPLLSLLTREAGPQAGDLRVEIPFSRNHWEAMWVARRLPLARGWERQLDVERNGLFYGRPALTPAHYRRWLSDLSVGFVALSDAPLDSAGRAEAALVRRGVPYLRPIGSAGAWRVWRVVPAPASVNPPTARASLGDRPRLWAPRPGTYTLRVRWTPGWTLTRGRGCVEPAGAWTRVQLASAGSVELAPRFAPARALGLTAGCSAAHPRPPLKRPSNRTHG